MAGYFAQQPSSSIAALARQNRYRFPERVERDISTCRTLYPDLKADVSSFTYDDGRNAVMLYLTGTIPITYKGARYNIPVRVWLDTSYPEVPPMPMVTPTQDMVVKMGPQVDSSGKVYLPYLHAWDQHQSNLSGLCAIMCDVFGQNPPVYSRAQAAAAQAYQQQAQAYKPPYSTQAYPNPNPNPNPASSTHTPAYPSASSSSSSYYTHTQQQPPVASAVSSAYTPYTANPLSSSSSSSLHHTSSSSSAVAVNGSVSVSARPTASSQHDSSSKLQSQEEDEAMQQVMLESLQSHVKEQALRKIQAFMSEKRASINELYAQDQALQAGAADISGIMDKLAREESLVTAAITTLRDKISQLETTVKGLEGSEQANIDEVVTTTAPLYKQLLDQVAEDNAIDDLIYHLGKALESGSIDIQAYVKHLRSLAERQFRCRTLIHKARVQAKLE